MPEPVPCEQMFVFWYVILSSLMMEVIKDNRDLKILELWNFSKSNFGKDYFERFLLDNFYTFLIWLKNWILNIFIRTSKLQWDGNMPLWL